MATSAKPSKLSAINIIFILFIVAAVISAAQSGKMKETSDASFEQAKAAVSLAINLVGIMALWLGMMRVLEAGGAMQALGRMLKPVMTRLFKDVPPEHPAMSAMILNFSANMLGLGNAATPFGLRAMQELNKLNPLPGTATNAMCLFLAINTSSIALLPLGVIGVRAAAGATVPTAIMLPTLLATICSTVAALIAAKYLERRGQAAYSAEVKEHGQLSGAAAEADAVKIETYEHLLITPSATMKYLALGAASFLFGIFLFRLVNAADVANFITKEFLGQWLMPVLMFGIVLFGVGRGVKVYEAVTEGAKQGFDIAVRIIPFLVTILVAVGVFRASGAFDYVLSFLQPLTDRLGVPADTLPMAVIRPLSGSGAFAVMSELINNAPDSYSAYVASTMMGSTETTFYVLAIYFGAAGVTRIRHALPAAIIADIAGTVASYIFCALLWQQPGLA